MYQATIEDPTIFTSAWTVEVPLHPSDGQIFEVACHEGNLGLGCHLVGASRRRARRRRPLNEHWRGNPCN